MDIAAKAEEKIKAPDFVLKDVGGKIQVSDVNLSCNSCGTLTPSKKFLDKNIPSLFAESI